jgi:hypothetical protein
MRTLLRQGLQRLAGQSGQAVFELKQSMGGGKTHSMLALGYLGANPGLAHLIPQEIVEGFKPAKARVVCEWIWRARQFLANLLSISCCRIALKGKLFMNELPPPSGARHAPSHSAVFRATNPVVRDPERFC